MASIRKSINNVKLLYAATPYNHVNDSKISQIDLGSLTVLIDDQLFFEMILLEIRGETIKYSSKRKHDIDGEENNLKENIICDIERELSNENDIAEATFILLTPFKL